MACNIEDLAKHAVKEEGDAAIEEAILKDKKGKAQQDLYGDMHKNPLKYAEGIVAKQNTMLRGLLDGIGIVAVKVIKPTASIVDEKLSKYSVYNDTLSMIRTGFVSSEIAQQMRDTLNVQSKVDQNLLNKMLQVSDDVQQRMADYLTVNLPDLDKRVQKEYKSKEDQDTVFQLFSHTGISGLQYNSDVVKGLLYGDMTVDEALVKYGSRKDLKEIEAVANYYVTGDMKGGVINLDRAGIYDSDAKVIVALMAIKKVPNGEKILKSMKTPLKKELYGLTLVIESLHKEVNDQKEGYDGKKQKDSTYTSDYDGHLTMDVFEDRYEYKMVSVEGMKTSKYQGNDWQVIQEPTTKTIGILARENISSGKTPGVGLNSNRFKNGFFLTKDDTLALNRKLEGMNEVNRDKYLEDNKIVADQNGTYRVVLSDKIKKEKLKMKRNVAHSLYRTFVHNAELVQMQSVRDIIVDQAITSLKDEDDMRDLVSSIDKGEVVPMFLDIKYDYKEYEKLPTKIKELYKTPEGLSSYNGFNKKITLVKKGTAHMLLGFDNVAVFDQDKYRKAAKVERLFKELIVMAKQKMVVLSPSKLAVDAISNIGILGTKDVSLFEMKDGFRDGFKSYNEYSKLRGELVQEQLKDRMGIPNKVKAIERKLENHDFHNSFKYGFVQSYSTSLVVKEFDTVSGLQKTINSVIESVTTDKDGNYNEVQKAIKSWQRLGGDKLSVDHLLMSASQLSKVKGTKVGDEIKAMSERLKSKKDTDSVAEYINEIIGGPNSEAMKVGSGVMVTVDVVSKYTLAKSLLKRTNPKTKEMYTVEEAYSEANESFIDYRRNLPPEIQFLSDYGILMFPSFWMKAQKIIASMLYYHPATALGSYGIANYLDIESSSFIDTNLITKTVDGRVFNDPTSVIDSDVISWLF